MLGGLSLIAILVMVANHSAVIGDGSLQALFIDALSYDFFDYFVPIMIAAIILEALASWIYEKDQYSLNDAIMRYAHHNQRPNEESARSPE